jgi:hypothetical protein
VRSILRCFLLFIIFFSVAAFVICVGAWVRMRVCVGRGGGGGGGGC